MFESNEPLLKGIKVEEKYDGLAQRLSFPVELEDFNGFPETVADIFGYELRRIYGHRVVAEQVRDLKAVSNGNGSKKVTFTYDLFLTLETSRVEIDGKIFLVEI